MLKRILLIVVALVVIGGLGLFVLDRTLFAPSQVSTSAPVAPTLAAPTLDASVSGAPTQAPTTVAAQPAQPLATSATAAQQPTVAASTNSGAAGKATVYHIDPSQSEAHYEVAETFFQGNRLNLAIGRTKGVAGDILVDFANPANSQIGTIVIDVSQLKSDENRRDNFIRNNGLQSAQYPQATFKPTKVEGLPASVKPGDTLTLKVTGDLTVKDTTKPVTFDVTLTADPSQVKGTASTEIALSDFGAGPIQIAMLQTEDKAKLVFDFVAVPGQ